jgi:amino acid transporter
MAMHEVEGPFGVGVPTSEEAPQLAANSLSLFDATAVAVSSVAPAYSLAATVGLVIATAGVGLFAPSVVILSFIPVVFIAYAYFHMNRKDPNCGASYAWLSKLVRPSMGWFNGWVQVATSVIFCISAPLLAGQYTLTFAQKQGWIADSVANSFWTATLVGAAWLIFITFICVYGIRWTVDFQWVLVIIEYVCVVGFSLGGIIKVIASHPAGSSSFNLQWLNPFNVSGFNGLAGGVALGVFFFWGWDTSVNLNEETKNKTKTPGRAGIISMWLLLVVYVMNFVAIQMLLSPKQIANNSGDILFFFGGQLFGSWAGFVMIVAVLTSTVATTQTTLLPSARIALSMSRDKVFPKLFGTINPKFLTPAIGTIVLAAIAFIGMMLNAGSPSINTVFSNLISNIGVLVAFYYGITGITCAWAFRKVAFQKVSFLFIGIVAPLLSGVFLLFVGFWVIKTAGWTALPDIIILAGGIPLVLLARFTTKGDFFKVKPIAYTSIE